MVFLQQGLVGGWDRCISVGRSIWCGAKGARIPDRLDLGDKPVNARLGLHKGATSRGAFREIRSSRLENSIDATEEDFYS